MVPHKPPQASLPEVLECEPPCAREGCSTQRHVMASGIVARCTVVELAFNVSDQGARTWVRVGVGVRVRVRVRVRLGLGLGWVRVRASLGLGLGSVLGLGR